jgi:hypothetical protein
MKREYIGVFYCHWLRRLGQPPAGTGICLRLWTASPQIKRQVFEAFDLQIAVDKTEGRVEISATVSEDVAKAPNSKDPLARGGLSVVPRDIAGARFVSQGDARILVQVAA